MCSLTSRGQVESFRTDRGFINRAMSAACTVILAGLLSSPALAQLYEFESSFGSEGTQVGQFTDPVDVAVDSKNRLLITDTFNARIQVCDHAGTCTAFGMEGFEAGEFFSPWGIDVDSQDRLYIADESNHRVQRCTRTGNCKVYDTFLSSDPNPSMQPRGLALGLQDQLVIADTNRHRVRVCTSERNCTAFGSMGDAVGQFFFPEAVDIDAQGRAIVTDNALNRVQICTLQGQCTAFGSFGSDPGQFNAPLGVAALGEDLIVVADTNNGRLQICDNLGACSEVNPFSGGPNDFHRVIGVAVDREGRIIAVDSGARNIKIFKPLFLLIATFEGPSETVMTGESFRLEWHVANATSCTGVDGAGGWDSMNINASAGHADLVVTEPGEYTFTLQCMAGLEQVTRSITVKVSNFRMNAGHNDAWFNLLTAGQGFFVIVFEEIGFVFVAWFTFDTERPANNIIAILGEPGHRWLTAFGPLDGARAVLDIEVTSGGIFDDSPPVPDQVAGGTLILEFEDCTKGTVTYDITAINSQGVVPITRIANDNVALCESILANTQ